MKASARYTFRVTTSTILEVGERHATSLMAPDSLNIHPGRKYHAGTATTRAYNRAVDSYPIKSLHAEHDSRIVILTTRSSWPRGQPTSSPIASLHDPAPIWRRCIGTTALDRTSNMLKARFWVCCTPSAGVSNTSS